MWLLAAWSRQSTRFTWQHWLRPSSLLSITDLNHLSDQDQLGRREHLRRPPTSHRADREQQKRIDGVLRTVLWILASKRQSPTGFRLSAAVELEVDPDPPQRSPIGVPVVDEQ